MNQNEWLEEMERVKQSGVDLSRDQDLSIALMNLISLEEHFYFSSMKTNKKKYLEMMHACRQLRKTLLAKIVINPEGEDWCISKHLLATSMRLYEVGTKEYSKGEKKEAYKFFTAAFDMYSLFFEVNHRLKEESGEIVNENLQGKIHPSTMKYTQNRIADDAIEGDQSGAQPNTVFAKVSSIVKKIVDCCKEW